MMTSASFSAAFWARLAGIALALGATPGVAADFKPDVLGTTTIPAGLQRVYVFDDALPHMPDGRIYVLDAATLSMKGLLESGFAGMMVAAPAKHKVYVATTFYERLSRGKRTDVIQVFDDQTLKVVDEIPIPPVRAQALSYRSLFQPSADGSLLFVQNATPATSVTVVDPASKKELEIAAPGCYGIYPALTKPLRFSTLCGDGTLGTYTVAADLRASERKASAKLFDVDADPLFIHAERDGDSYVFLGFNGKLLRVSVESDTASVAETADIVPADAADWRPGGYQPFTIDAKAGVAYILMHKGVSNGGHKNPSAEIWAYDLRGKKLLMRSPAAGLTSITLSAADPTVLFAINGVDAKIMRFKIDPGSRNVAAAGEIKLGETAGLIEAP